MENPSRLFWSSAHHSQPRACSDGTTIGGSGGIESGPWRIR